MRRNSACAKSVPRAQLCPPSRTLYVRVDYPRFFRAWRFQRRARGERTLRVMSTAPRLDAWAPTTALTWRKNERAGGAQSLMDASTRSTVRNYLAQNASPAPKNHYSEFQKLLELRDPFAEHPGMEEYAAPPPAWGRGLVLSCSS